MNKQAQKRRQRPFGYKFVVRIRCPECDKGLFTPDQLVWHLINEHTTKIVDGYEFEWEDDDFKYELIIWWRDKENV